MLKYFIFPFIMATSIYYLLDLAIFKESDQITSNQSVTVGTERYENFKNKLTYVAEENPDTSEPWINLESVVAVFESLGYHRVRLPSKKTEGIHYDWDIMWTWNHNDDTFFIDFSRLKLHQKINHFPGIGCLAQKDVLAENTKSKYIPRGFSSFEDLKKYAEANPTKRFVEKLSSNDGITLKTFTDIRFEATLEGDMLFAQEFVENPLLIDGHMWDFGIYVVITSVEPLRVYYYTENCVIRFGKLPYKHDDFSDEDTYVVDSDKTVGQVFPAFHDYRNFSYTHVVTLKSNLRKIGVDPQLILEQVEDCIDKVTAANEIFLIERIKEAAPSYGKYHFFELLRFDFIVDDQSNLHLLEVNLSPNIGQIDEEYFIHKNMYRALIRNVFDMVGIGPTSLHTLLKEENGDEKLDYLSYDKFIATSPEECMSEECTSCALEKCQLCVNCMNDNFKFDLRVAFMEHMYSGCFKRACPRSNVCKMRIN